MCDLNLYLGSGATNEVHIGRDSTHPIYTLGPTYIATSGGNVGIATSSPGSLFDVYSAATTTVTIDSDAATKGSCLKLKDYDGGGYTYCRVLNGTLTCNTDSCE